MNKRKKPRSQPSHFPFHPLYSFPLAPIFDHMSFSRAKHNNPSSNIVKQGKVRLDIPTVLHLPSSTANQNTVIHIPYRTSSPQGSATTVPPNYSNLPYRTSGICRSIDGSEGSSAEDMNTNWLQLQIIF